MRPGGSARFRQDRLGCLMAAVGAWNWDAHTLNVTAMPADRKARLRVLLMTLVRPLCPVSKSLLVKLIVSYVWQICRGAGALERCRC